MRVDRSIVPRRRVRQPCAYWRGSARQNGRGPGPSFCNPPPRCRRRNAERTISDVFDSPERSEDYRDMYDTRTEGTPGAFRRSGAAGRPRAASQPAYALHSAMPAAASLEQLSMLRACFVEVAARGRAASPTTRGHKILYFHDFHSSHGYKSVVPLSYPSGAKIRRLSGYRTPGVR